MVLLPQLLGESGTVCPVTWLDDHQIEIIGHV
jgi:hypothetical protein